MIYLDAGATTLQKPPAVALAVQSAMCRMATPGRGGHPPAMRAADAVYDCRCLAGALFDAQPEQVVFTMNATSTASLMAQPREPVVSGSLARIARPTFVVFDGLGVTLAP